MINVSLSVVEEFAQAHRVFYQLPIIEDHMRVFSLAPPVDEHRKQQLRSADEKRRTTEYRKAAQRIYRATWKRNHRKDAA